MQWEAHARKRTKLRIRVVGDPYCYYFCVVQKSGECAAQRDRADRISIKWPSAGRARDDGKVRESEMGPGGRMIVVTCQEGANVAGSVALPSGNRPGTRRSLPRGDVPRAADRTSMLWAGRSASVRPEGHTSDARRPGQHTSRLTEGGGGGDSACTSRVQWTPRAT